jgi:hypothetical protein
MLRCGEVRVAGVAFASSALVVLGEQLDFDAVVEVAVDPDDLSRAWVFDPIIQEWLEAKARRASDQSPMI